MQKWHFWLYTLHFWYYVRRLHGAIIHDKCFNQWKFVCKRCWHVYLCMYMSKESLDNTHIRDVTNHQPRHASSSLTVCIALGMPIFSAPLLDDQLGKDIFVVWIGKSMREYKKEQLSTKCILLLSRRGDFALSACTNSVTFSSIDSLDFDFVNQLWYFQPFFGCLDRPFSCRHSRALCWCLHAMATCAAETRQIGSLLA
jgi:hypothetical protein